MISQTYANKILETLFSTISLESSLDTNGRVIYTNLPTKHLKMNQNVYLGLCADAPKSDTGDLTSAKEPDIGGDAKYARRLVSGYESGVNFFNAAANGKITNSQEIQFPTAQENYPNKMKYWFLTHQATKPSTNNTAFLWGDIKDVLHEALTDDAVNNQNWKTDTSNGLKYIEFVIEDPFTILTNETYTVIWDDIETKDLPVTVKSNISGTNEATGATESFTYAYIGNVGKLVSGTQLTNDPFVISYKIQRADDAQLNDSVGITLRSEGRLRFYTCDANDTKKETISHKLGLYGQGININKSTVPTFYTGQLQASIDVAK